MDLLFDLDGTLVDSADGILSSLAAALCACGLQPVRPLDRTLIGAPLGKVLQQISGLDAPELLEGLTQAFKSHYDSEGCLESRPYPGVPELLRFLVHRGHRLFIVTNKRYLPTCSILRHLGLEVLFAGIHSIDGAEPPASSKAELVRQTIHRHGIVPEEGLLIGDSMDDGLAAQTNGLLFIFAAYGYGVLDDPPFPCLARICAFADLRSLVPGLKTHPG